MIDDYVDRWALITGASSGIGAAFARRLASRGMHVVLTARREERLRELAEELHTRHGTRSELVPGDLSAPGAAARLVGEVESRGIEIELLVNNAGFAIVGEVEDVDVERAMQLVRLNIGAVTELTYRVLPEMIERGHGAIINVASMAGLQPVAYMPAYSASKAFVLHFSEALWPECHDKGVSVMALCPGFTRTELFEKAGVAGWLKKHRFQTPERVVKAALKGLEKGRQYVVPGWRNYLLSLLPRIATRRRTVLESMRFFRPPPRTGESQPASDAAQSGDSQGERKTAEKTAEAPGGGL